jgi:hypothetical protein
MVDSIVLAEISLRYIWLVVVYFLNGFAYPPLGVNNVHNFYTADRNVKCEERRPGDGVCVLRRAKPAARASEPNVPRRASAWLLALQLAGSPHT